VRTPLGSGNQKEVWMHEKSSADQRSESSEGQREYSECRNCDGTGTVVQDAEYDSARGGLVQAVVMCPVCNGEGTISVFMYPLRSIR
jgi:DnaJ-class molecular chaperone